MGHNVCGILGTEKPLARVRLAPLGPLTPLDGGIAWLPWNGARVLSLDEESMPEHEYLDGELARHLAVASGPEGLAFIETRYFGGMGGQIATAWVDGRCVVDRGTVNAALRALGVSSAPGKHDEWDTIGLQRFRSNPR